MKEITISLTDRQWLEIDAIAQKIQEPVEHVAVGSIMALLMEISHMDESDPAELIQESIRRHVTPRKPETSSWEGPSPWHIN